MECTQQHDDAAMHRRGIATRAGNGGAASDGGAHGSSDDARPDREDGAQKLSALI